jgi:DNA-binding transcriptional MocR family regulator
MTITNTDVLKVLPKLRLTQTAYDLLFTMSDMQETGGIVRASQRELAARIGASRNALQRAMGLLVDRGLVMEPQKYRTYELHPFIADYADEAALHTAFADALTRINAGELLDIAPPEYDVQPPKKAGAPALQRVS